MAAASRKLRPLSSEEAIKEIFSFVENESDCEDGYDLDELLGEENDEIASDSPAEDEEVIVADEIDELASLASALLQHIKGRLLPPID